MDSTVFEVSSPWVICGGNVSASFAPHSGQCGIDFTVDAANATAWQHVWSGSCGSSTSEMLDKLIQPHQEPNQGVYEYSLRLRLPSGVKASRLKIVTDVMANPLSLPRLDLGANTFEYTDDSHPAAGVDRDILITHTFQESSTVRPLPPPEAPSFPVDKASVRRDNATFSWPAVPGAEEYHVVVSLREDHAWPYRSQLDTIIPSNSLVNPWLGLFSPGMKYYWRVRAKAGAGLWGAWSSTWSFTWLGPGVPADVAVATNGCQHAKLSWKPSRQAGAEPAVSYEVYGSNETGFTPRRVAQPVLGLSGLQPPNLVATVTAPELLVPPLAQAHYRVVAVDAAGTRGGASDMVHVPRPCVYSCPVTTAAVGKPYSDTLLPSLAFGDLQFRECAPAFALPVCTATATDGAVWTGAPTRPRPSSARTSSRSKALASMRTPRRAG